MTERRILRLFIEGNGRATIAPDTLLDGGLDVSAANPLEAAAKALQAAGEAPETVVEVWDRVRPYARYRAALGDLWGYWTWPRPPGTEQPLPPLP